MADATCATSGDTDVLGQAVKVWARSGAAQGGGASKAVLVVFGAELAARAAAAWQAALPGRVVALHLFPLPGETAQAAEHALKEACARVGIPQVAARVHPVYCSDAFEECAHCMGQPGGGVVPREAYEHCTVAVHAGAAAVVAAGVGSEPGDPQWDGAVFHMLLAGLLAEQQAVPACTVAFQEGPDASSIVRATCSGSRAVWAVHGVGVDATPYAPRWKSGDTCPVRLGEHPQCTVLHPGLLMDAAAAGGMHAVGSIGSSTPAGGDNGAPVELPWRVTVFTSATTNTKASEVLQGQATLFAHAQYNPHE